MTDTLTEKDLSNLDKQTLIQGQLLVPTDVYIYFPFLLQKGQKGSQSLHDNSRVTKL